MKTKDQNSKHLYVHVPFCKDFCTYCDFCHYLAKDRFIIPWLKALKKEIAFKKMNYSYETIYIGGGTPSILSLAHLRELLEILKPYTEHVLEYTFEANPESLDAFKADLLSDYGINRISLGMQTHDAKILKAIRRQHSFDDVRKTVDLLKIRGIRNISLDLIYGLPFQDLFSFKQSIEKALSLDIDHISLYALTLERGTSLYHQNYHLIDEDLDADMYEMAKDILEKAGFENYEVSNFARHQSYSLHNLAYWNYDDYDALSLSASGKRGLYRYDNTKSLIEYFKGNYIENEYQLDLKEAAFENIMMSFRTQFGLDLGLFAKRYKVSFFELYQKAFEKRKSDFIKIADHLVVKDRAILNDILLDFMDQDF